MGGCTLVRKGILMIRRRILTGAAVAALSFTGLGMSGAQAAPVQSAPVQAAWSSCMPIMPYITYPSLYIGQRPYAQTALDIQINGAGCEVRALSGSVMNLQKRLRAHGYSYVAVDGSFGSATRSAVISFQRSRGLVQDGIVGPATQRYIGLAYVVA